MVFSGLFPVDGSDFPALRDALDKLKLNDAALTYEPETSVALGFGFRCGYLGLLHLEIIRERLEREFDLGIISTAPSVVYEVTLEDRSTHTDTLFDFSQNKKKKEAHWKKDKNFCRGYFSSRGFDDIVFMRAKRKTN